MSSNELNKFLNKNTKASTLFISDRHKTITNYQISNEELIYLTCFDPDDSTIFFYEYFTNKIIKDPSVPKKEEKVAKESPEKNQNENNLNDAIRTTTFANTTNTNTNNNIYAEKFSKEKKELITYFSDLWKKIKDLSELEKHSFYSDAVKNRFLKRPFISRFTFPEKLGINPISTTFPLPQILSRYDKVNINIYYDFSVSKFNEKELQPIVYEKNVGLFYVVDTLIKDALLNLRKKLKEHSEKKLNDSNVNEIEINDNNNNSDYLKEFDEMINNPKNKFLLKIGLVEEFIFGDSPISSNSFIRRKIREREKVNLLLIRKSENELKPNLSNFPLIIRIGTHQEYSYDILFNYFLRKINQKNELDAEKSIIFMYKNGIGNNNNNKENDQKEENPKNEINCEKLLTNFINNDSNLQNESKNTEEISDNFTEFYTKKNLKRREYLKKYCESGEADYPFTIKVKSITNLSAVLYHIKDKEYDFGNMILMNFKKKLKNKKNFMETLQERFNFCNKKKSNKEEKENEKERKHQAKMMKTRDNNYLKEKHLLDELNFMNFNKNKNFEEIYFNNKHKLLGFRDINFRLKDYYKPFLLKKSSEEIENFKNKIFNKADKLNFYNHTDETYNNPFNMILDYLNFLPVHILLEVSLVYGMCNVRLMKTRCTLIKEDIVINEKINFSQNKKKSQKNHDEKNKENHNEYDFLYYSNIPRESRLCFEIICYDAEMKKKFVLGSSSLQIYNEHGIMKTGLQEVYIWPLFENDLKIPFSTQFHYKKSTFITDKDNFDKRNYGIIYVEFPKFTTNVINTYKTPNSYSEFLRIKNLNKNIKTHREFKRFYGESITSTEKIFKNFYYSYLNINNKNNFNNNNENNHQNSEENLLEKSEEKDENSNFLTNENFFEKLLQILNIEPLKKIEDNERETLINARDYISTIPSKLELFLRCINWFDPIQAYIAKIYLKKWARIEPIDAVGLLDSRFINTYVREYALSILNEGTDDIKDLYLLQIIYAQMNDCYLEGHLTDFIIENCLRSTYFASKFIFMSKLLKDNPLFTERLGIITAQIFMLSGTKLIYEIKKTYDVSNLFSKASVRAKGLRKKDKSKEQLTHEVKTELGNLFNTIAIKAAKEKKRNEEIQENEENNNEENPEQYKNKNFNNGDNNNNEVEILRKTHYDNLSEDTLINVNIPVFPGFFFSDVIFNSLKAYDSKMVPMEYALYPSEGNYFQKMEDKFEDLRMEKNNDNKEKKKKTGDMRIFYKNGDDLRQDHLALLALRTMDKLWLENDLDLKVFGYSVLPTGVKDGFLEKCNATPYNDVQTGKTISGIFDRELIKKYFDKKAKEIVDMETVGKAKSVEEIKSQQTDNFVRSLAGYCVGTCVLGIADRHSDNIMIQDNGVFLHIDYGHILGNFKEKMGFKREKSKFVLDQTMVNFCKQVNMEEDFKNFCVKAYNILRKNSNRLLNLLMVLSTSGMPELYCMNNIRYFIENLKLDKKNDEDAGNYFLCLINQSKNDKYRYLDNIFHNINHLKVGGAAKKAGEKDMSFCEKYFGFIKKGKKDKSKNNPGANNGNVNNNEGKN